MKFVGQISNATMERYVKKEDVSLLFAKRQKIVSSEIFVKIGAALSNQQSPVRQQMIAQRERYVWMADAKHHHALTMMIVLMAKGVKKVYVGLKSAA